MTDTKKKPYVIVAAADFFRVVGGSRVQAGVRAGQVRSRGAEVHLVNVVQTYGAQVAYEMPMDASGADRPHHYGKARAGRFKTYADPSGWRGFKGAQPCSRALGAWWHTSASTPIAPEIAQLAADLEADLVVCWHAGAARDRGRCAARFDLPRATVRLAPCPGAGRETQGGPRGAATHRGRLARAVSKPGAKSAGRRAVVRAAP